MNEVNDNEEEGGRKWRGTKLSPVAIPPPRSTEDERGGKGATATTREKGEKMAVLRGRPLSLAV